MRRVHYQISIRKNSHIAKTNIPVVSKRHGWTRVNGVLETLWIEGEVLPRRLIDIYQDFIDTHSDEEGEEEGSDAELDGKVD